MLYFDTSYLVRLYIQEPGWEKVCELSAKHAIACCSLGRTELYASFHRKLREKHLSVSNYELLIAQFEHERKHLKWLPFSEAVIERVNATYVHLPSNAFLRSADAIHLASAAEAGLSEIYTNDRNILACARYFGLAGINVL